jgi:hypothetical protein
MRWAGHVASMGETSNASATKFYLENLKGRNNLEDQGVDGLEEMVFEDVDCIHLAQLQAVVNMPLNLGFHKRWGIYCLAERLLTSQVGLYSMELLKITLAMEFKHYYIVQLHPM